MLLDRNFYILLNNKEKMYGKIISGIPQGSPLGPLLFSFYVIDLGSIMMDDHLKILLYADDLKLLYRINSINDTANFQGHIIALQNWVAENGLSLNFDKSFIVHFSKKTNIINWVYKIDNTPLTVKKSVKDLGIVYDEKGNFNRHVISLSSEVSKRVGVIRRLTNFFKDPDIFLLLYRTLVLSRILYCTPIWYTGQNYSFIKLLKVNSRFLKYFHGVNPKYKYTGCSIESGHLL